MPDTVTDAQKRTMIAHIRQAEAKRNDTLSEFGAEDANFGTLTYWCETCQKGEWQACVMIAPPTHRSFARFHRDLDAFVVATGRQPMNCPSCTGRTDILSLYFCMYLPERKRDWRCNLVYRDTRRIGESHFSVGVDGVRAKHPPLRTHDDFHQAFGFRFSVKDCWSDLLAVPLQAREVRHRIVEPGYLLQVFRFVEQTQPEVDAIREQRVAQMKAAGISKAEGLYEGALDRAVTKYGFTDDIYSEWLPGDHARDIAAEDLCCYFLISIPHFKAAIRAQAGLWKLTVLEHGDRTIVMDRGRRVDLPVEDLLLKCGYSGHSFSRTFYHFALPYLRGGRSHS